MTCSRCLTATQQRQHHPPDTEYNRIEVVVYSLTSHIPIYYKELPGNMPDCSTIEFIMKKLEHIGFFASKAIGVDFDPLQAMNNYGMRDEQEKRFALQKGPLGHDHLRTWSEGGKRGRMFIYFVGLIFASYVRSVWQKDDVLRKKFSSTEVVLQSTFPRLSQQPTKEVARLNQKWKNKSFRYTKLKNSERFVL